MFRRARVGAFMFFMLASADGAAQDYVGPLTALSQLGSNGQYREAIAGYQKLQAQPGTPAWLKASAELEIADLHAALGEHGQAAAALSRASSLGADDCLSPRASKHLATALKDPKAAQALAAMKLSEADFRELAWLQAEVEFAGHDARLMIADNISRVDQQSTTVPQAVVPTRATHSAGVLYWRQQLLLMQKAQREFVQQSDQERMVHAATLSVSSGSDSSSVLASARQAAAAAEARKAAIRQRAFVASASAGATVRPCIEWAAQR
jgi:hypothetical protein